MCSYNMISTASLSVIMACTQAVYCQGTRATDNIHSISNIIKLSPLPLAWAPPGSFIMGSPPEELGRQQDESPQTRVVFTKGFLIGKYEITQGEYAIVMKQNPSHFKGTTNLPIESITFSNMLVFCERLTTNERKAGRIPADWVYRMPTEPEWEYACRAGTKTPYHFGKTFSARFANCRDAIDALPVPGKDPLAICKTTPVGSYKPNSFGIYDMHGNVWERCIDKCSKSLPGGTITDPKPVTSGFGRIIRGGAANVVPVACRSANRVFGDDKDGPHLFIGFRVVLVPLANPVEL